MLFYVLRFRSECLLSENPVNRLKHWRSKILKYIRGKAAVEKQMFDRDENE